MHFLSTHFTDLHIILSIQFTIANPIGKEEYICSIQFHVLIDFAEKMCNKPVILANPVKKENRNLNIIVQIPTPAQFFIHPLIPV